MVKNVNGGYTDFNENIIFVWRHEEFEKEVNEERELFAETPHTEMKNHYPGNL